MNGSVKQVKWAEEIRDAKMGEFDELMEAAQKATDETRAKVAMRAVEFVRDISDASFWIDYRNFSAERMVSALFTGTLKVKGFSFDHIAKIDTTTGEIVVRWEEIVPDGKGGHTVNRQKVI